jgi:hypothetical protein
MLVLPAEKEAEEEEDGAVSGVAAAARSTTAAPPLQSTASLTSARSGESSYSDPHRHSPPPSLAPPLALLPSRPLAHANRSNPPMRTSTSSCSCACSSPTFGCLSTRSWSAPAVVFGESSAVGTHGRALRSMHRAVPHAFEPAGRGGITGADRQTRQLLPLNEYPAQPASSNCRYIERTCACVRACVNSYNSTLKMLIRLNDTAVNMLLCEHIWIYCLLKLTATPIHHVLYMTRYEERNKGTCIQCSTQQLHRCKPYYKPYYKRTVCIA